MKIGDHVMMHSGTHALRHACIEEIHHGLEHPFATIRFFNLDGNPSRTRLDMVNSNRFNNFGPYRDLPRKRA